MTYRPAACLVVLIALASASAAGTDVPMQVAGNPLAERLGLAPKLEPLPPVPPACEPLPPPNPLAERLKPTFELRGRIEVDAVMAAQSTASQAQIGTLQDGYGFRRARLGAQGTIGSSAMWVAEIDFANGNFRPRDVYVGLTSIPYIQQVNIGYFREPFTLEGSTSARYITFMERSPLNELDPARAWGMAGYWWPENERMTFAIGAFRTGTNSGGFSGQGGHWAVTTRLTGLPIYEDSDRAFKLLHIGAAFSQLQPANGVVNYDVTPQTNILQVSDSPASPFLPNVNVPSNSQQLYDLQAAWVNGPLSFQGEWIATTIQQKDAGMVFLHGCYAYVSYFVTGEHRGYVMKEGAFGPVQVHRPLLRKGHWGATGCGAVELAARIAVANFSSPNLPQSIPQAGAPIGTILYEGTLGLNWYLNDYTRLMFNYTLSVPAAKGDSDLPVNGFGIRTAIYW